MRVLIVGEGKSGTTALMRSVASCLEDPVEMFEPLTLRGADLEPESLVVKKLLLNWQRAENDLLDRFDKRLFISRDPRDRIISHLLYDAYNRAPTLSANRRQRWLTALQRKVDDPTGVSVSKLITQWWQISQADLMSHYVRASDRSIGFHKKNGPLFHLVSYEDYVSGSFSELNEHLGLAIQPGVVTGAETRVVRSKAAGAWRDWFTPLDVDVFRPMTYRWLDEVAGEPKDWELTPEPVIDPETSVGYVASLFERVPEPQKSKKTKNKNKKKRARKKA